MRVRALRGVCIGPSRHLVLGETSDLDDGTAKFLVSIGAVECVAEEPPKAPPAPEPPAKVLDDPKLVKPKEK